MASVVAWIDLLLVIIVIVLIIIIYVFFFNHRNDVIIHGVSFTIQDGTLTASTDNMVTGGNNMYIGRSSADMQLTILSNSNNKKGQVIAIKNTSTKTISLQAGAGFFLDLGPISNIVLPGVYAQLIALNNANSFLRLQ